MNFQSLADYLPSVPKQVVGNKTAHRKLGTVLKRQTATTTGKKKFSYGLVVVVQVKENWEIYPRGGQMGGHCP